LDLEEHKKIDHNDSEKGNITWSFFFIEYWEEEPNAVLVAWNA
jgi:hypothetical protein